MVSITEEVLSGGRAVVRPCVTWCLRSPPHCVRPCPIHRRDISGIQEEVIMLDLFILAVGFAGGYAASVVSWPWIRAHAIGTAAEINRLRARAKALEDQIKGVL
jgi:hypothetical protein